MPRQFILSLSATAICGVVVHMPFLKHVPWGPGPWRMNIPCLLMEPQALSGWSKLEDGPLSLVKACTLLLHGRLAWPPGYGILAFPSESSPVSLVCLQPSKELSVPWLFFSPVFLECCFPMV